MDPSPSQVPKVRIELTPEEKEIARSLESFPYLEMKDRVFLMLVWRKLKIASPVSIQPNAPNSALQDFKNMIQKAGLLSKPDRVIYENMRGLRPGQICFVADNQQDLNSISQLWFGDHEKDPEVYKEIGRMSGFPTTAIETYGKFSGISEPERGALMGQLLLTEEEKKKLFPAELYYFSSFFYM